MGKKNGSVTKYTKEDVLAAIQGTGPWEGQGTCGGMRSLVIKRLGVSPKTFYGYLKRWPTLRDALAAEEPKGVDMVAATLFEKALTGDNACMFFYLKTKGGWVERREIAGPGGGPIQTNVSGAVKHEHSFDPKPDFVSDVLRVLLQSGAIEDEDGPGDVLGEAGVPGPEEGGH